MPAGSAAELYVHAIAVEREAARRYGELAAAALAAEKQARAFFEQVYRTAMDDALRALAHEMAAEEDAHIALLARL